MIISRNETDLLKGGFYIQCFPYTVSIHVMTYVTRTGHKMLVPVHVLNISIAIVNGMKMFAVFAGASVQPEKAQKRAKRCMRTKMLYYIKMYLL